MIILSANNLGKIYGTDVIFEHASFAINQGDRIGIVGKNGAGKTTLLNMLTGEMSVDEGEFFVSESCKIGYLKQRDNFFMKSTVYEEIDNIFTELHAIERETEEVTNLIDEKGKRGEDVSKLVSRLDELHMAYDIKGGYTYKSEITGVLHSMGFTKEWYDKKIESLSGGERTRLALSALLLKKPDILLMDEPTNHLDIQTLKWLEQYLSAYKGTLMIVSHDRYFLDQVVSRIFEVSNHKVSVYEGNYSKYVAERKVRFESEMRAYENQQKEIRRQEDMIRIMKEHNTEHLVKRAQSREKRLDMLDRLERPEQDNRKMKIHFRQNFQSGNDVLSLDDVSKGFYDLKTGKVNTLFSHVSCDIKRGERICIVGPNGVGKTTLLRTILGELEPKEGRIKIGHNVAFGYYDQGQLLLNNSNTVLDELHDSYRLYTETEMRNILGRFLFRNDDVFLNVGSLSGGEKARLSLVKMMLSGANTLILDEPTNHLDIDSKEAFEEALLDFPGTSIIVSHDRYFLEKIPTRILELTADGMTEYLGNYDYYLERKEKMAAGSGNNKNRNFGNNSNSNNSNSNKSNNGNNSNNGVGGSSSQDKSAVALGNSGISSVSGTSGASSVSGVSGASGATGTSRISGTSGLSGSSRASGVSGLSAQEERQLKKQWEAEERRLLRKIEKLEAEMDNIRSEISSLEVEISDPKNMTNYEVLGQLGEKLSQLKEELEEKETDYLFTDEELTEHRALVQ